MRRIGVLSALVGLVCIAVGCVNGRASAVTAEVARKCAALTAKAYPPQVPGNPAAGLAKGTVQSKRDYSDQARRTSFAGRLGLT